jgi:tRNA(Ile)-lysidine synthase
MSGAKKIKKLFIDLKIDSNIRNNIPMITIGNEVLFIPQVKVSKNFKALQGEESMKIIFKEAYFGR